MAGEIGKKIKTMMSGLGGLAFILIMFGGGDVIVDMIFSIGGDDQSVNDPTLVENTVPTVEDIRERIAENSDSIDRSAETPAHVPRYNHAPLIVALPFFIIAGALAVWFLRRK